MIQLELSNVAVGYNKAIVLDIDLISKPGKILALVGPNGCGKSTILKTSCGLLKEKAGIVLLNSNRMETISGRERAKNLSVLLTNNKVEEYTTCKEVVEIGRYNFTGIIGNLTKEDHYQVDEALTLVGAYHLKDIYFNNLSDGWKQRIFLARALAQEPKILILDEPTSFLDIGYKLEFLKILRNLVKERQLSVIVSLHEVELVRYFTDEVLCIKDNSIIKEGPTKEVLTKEFISELFDIQDKSLEEIYNFN